jgi:nitronate monooxygenase
MLGGNASKEHATLQTTDRLARFPRPPLVTADRKHRCSGLSGVELVIAACRNGVIGSFPDGELPRGRAARWLAHRNQRTAAPSRRRNRQAACAALSQSDRAPLQRAGSPEDLQVLLRHKPEMVITSVGSPVPVAKPLQDAGALVFADVASIRHAERAIAAGADGPGCCSRQAPGGQTGWLNPLVFTRAVRAFFDGPIVLAGGISDGHALRAAEALGCDLAYMGTKFIATRESMADAVTRRCWSQAAPTTSC